MRLIRESYLGERPQRELTDDVCEDAGERRATGRRQREGSEVLGASRVR